MKSPLPNPTDFELSVLRVLWERGPSTVREVFEALPSKKAYTTVLSIMQIMTEKGFLVPDKSKQAYIYSVTVPAEQVQRRLVNDLVERAFGGAARELVMQAVTASSTSAEELRKIKELIAAVEAKR